MSGDVFGHTDSIENFLKYICFPSKNRLFFKGLVYGFWTKSVFSLLYVRKDHGVL